MRFYTTSTALSSMMSSYNIFLFENKKDWSQIGSVEGDSIKNLTSSNLPKVVSVINQAIMEEIKEVQGKYAEAKSSNLSKKIGSRDDLMEYLFLDTMRYRRCTVYIVVQFSHRTKQVRIMAYGTDEILHTAECFGTSLSSVNKKELLQEVDKIIKSKLACPFLEINATALESLKRGSYILFI